MTQHKFKVGDKVKFVRNYDTLIAMAIPNVGAMGTVKTVCDVLPWYSIEWDIKEKDKDYSPWYLEEMLEGAKQNGNKNED